MSLFVLQVSTPLKVVCIFSLEVSDNDHYKRKRKKEKHKKKKKKRSRLRTPDKEDQCEKTKKDRLL